VPTLQDFHLPVSIATALEQLGWTADDPEIRETTPTAARGHNLVGVAPPVPAYVAPALAGALSRVGNGTRSLLLVPSAQLEPWGDLVHRLAQGSTIRSHLAKGTARAMRMLRSDAVDVLVTSPEVASILVSRSALTMGSIGTLVVAWPESWLDEEKLTPLMQDLPKDSQRVIYTADRQRVGTMVERYARKALTVGVSANAAAPAGPVRTVSAGWGQRTAVLADLVELLDPASLAIWTVDRSQHDVIRSSIALEEPASRLTVREVVPASTIIAFDLPPAERLAEMVSEGEVVLLVPPGSETYVASITTARRPIQLPGALEGARSVEEARRARIVQAAGSAQLTRSIAVLAPLLERHDPVTIAAALYELWTSEAGGTAEPARGVEATSKVFVGAGKKDGVTPNDLVAVLTKELRVDREKIGRIELRDAYSLVELPAQDAERLAGQLNGTTIRRKRVTAKVDRGSTRPRREDGDGRGRPVRRAPR
jgi:ATP-dependent RNA helicase DeaD